MNDIEEINQNYKDCEYIHTTYYEYDTGYAEYGCELTGNECLGDEYCPLSCKYSISE